MRFYCTERRSTRPENMENYNSICQPHNWGPKNKTNSYRQLRSHNMVIYIVTYGTFELVFFCGPRFLITCAQAIITISVCGI